MSEPFMNSLAQIGRLVHSIFYHVKMEIKLVTRRAACKYIVLDSFKTDSARLACKKRVCRLWNSRYASRLQSSLGSKQYLSVVV